MLLPTLKIWQHCDGKGIWQNCGLINKSFPLRVRQVGLPDQRLHYLRDIYTTAVDLRSVLDHLHQMCFVVFAPDVFGTNCTKCVFPLICTKYVSSHPTARNPLFVPDKLRLGQCQNFLSPLRHVATKGQHEEFYHASGKFLLYFEIIWKSKEAHFLSVD